MNNKDMPAMPLPNGADNRPYNLMDGEKFQKSHAMGLTKLEHFAGLAMQGLITLKGSDCQDTDITAKQCVRMAKALLAELDKVNDDE